MGGADDKDCKMTEQTTKVINIDKDHDDIWEEICNKVFADAFTGSHILETIEYLKSKYLIKEK